MSTLTAKQLFSNLQQLPNNERQQFFVMLSKVFADQDNLSHKDVFGHLETAQFTATEAAEYLEVSMATFRRYLNAKKLLANKVVGTTHLYSLDTLREFKKALRLIKPNEAGKD